MGDSKAKKVWGFVKVINAFRWVFLWLYGLSLVGKGVAGLIALALLWASRFLSLPWPVMAFSVLASVYLIGLFIWALRKPSTPETSEKMPDLSLVPHGDNSEYLYLEVVNEGQPVNLLSTLRVLSRNDGAKVKNFSYEGRWGLHPEPQGWWEGTPNPPPTCVSVGFAKSGMIQIAQYEKLNGLCSMKLVGLDERLLWDFEMKPNSVLPFFLLQVEIFSEGVGKIVKKTYEVGPKHAYGPLGMTEVPA